MLKHELRNLLSGTGKTKQENLIQAIAGYLAAGKTTGEKTEIAKLVKQEETKLITEYVNLHHLRSDLRFGKSPIKLRTYK